VRARDIAKERGLLHVYTGNVTYPPGDTTFCHNCGESLIEREWYEISQYRLTEFGYCKKCGFQLAGRFGKTAGDWGAKRRPVQL
ncbi:MAG: AmmeMemoRadiSam system radical SAM enzyme, partial [SAR324 cluster bacterium]|nr:AmmeMemoRadiSam system radical SAM enzyme [SAR324 cluster bacterium]